MQTVQYNTLCSVQKQLYSFPYSTHCTVQYGLYSNVQTVQYNTHYTIQLKLYINGSNFYVHGEFFFSITFFLPHRFRNSPVKKHCQWFLRFKYRVTHNQRARHFRTTVWNLKSFFFFHGSLKLYTVHQVGEGRRPLATKFSTSMPHIIFFVFRQLWATTVQKCKFSVWAHLEL